VKHWPFFLFLLMIALLVIAGSSLYFLRANFTEDYVQDLTSFHTAQLEMYKERCALFVTISTLILGATGAVMSREAPASNSRHKWAFFSATFAALGIYFGYLSYDAAIWMLDGHFFNLDNFVIAGLTKVQLCCSTLSIIGVVGVIFVK
jgi:hypothetical protein